MKFEFEESKQIRDGSIADERMMIDGSGAGGTEPDNYKRSDSKEALKRLLMKQATAMDDDDESEISEISEEGD